MKTLTLTTMLLLSGMGAMAQSSEKQGAATIIDVEQVSPEVFTGLMMDKETGEILTYLAHRPVGVNEVVDYVQKRKKGKPASTETIQDEAKGFSSLIR